MPFVVSLYPFSMHFTSLQLNWITIKRKLTQLYFLYFFFASYKYVLCIVCYCYVLRQDINLFDQIRPQLLYHPLEYIIYHCVIHIVRLRQHKISYIVCVMRRASFLNTHFFIFMRERNANFMNLP
jgi:hypothetical protein